MRIWSLHPKYLDAKGLVALWREALLAKNVLEGNTKGYKHHPQLKRFRETSDPVAAINNYLLSVHEEATMRGYKFNKDKIDWDAKPLRMKVTDGQVEFELKHLLNKLKVRDSKKHEQISELKSPDPHPIFIIVPGEVEGWEIL